MSYRTEGDTLEPLSVLKMSRFARNDNVFVEVMNRTARESGGRRAGMRTIVAVILAVTVLGSIASCASAPGEGRVPLVVVPRVDLNRYMGTWYEIASYPNSFQRGCTATKATYVLRDDGKVNVLNECRRGSLEGELTTARGTAKVVDGTTNAKLKVTFFWPFYGGYWIIDLGEAYDYAVVGHPSRKYLWVLSRSPSMDEASYNRILERLAAKQGYDVTKLVKTIQPKAP
jgi:apolipoprotein D and lipocalin family protein